MTYPFYARAPNADDLLPNGGAALQRMSDEELEYLRYQTRVAFANYLANNPNGFGAVSNGSGFTNIGTMQDISRTARSNVGSGNSQPGVQGPPGGDYPGEPGVGTSTLNYPVHQNRNAGGTPANFNFSWLKWDGDLDGTGALRRADIEDLRQLITFPNYNRMIGNETDPTPGLGTYRVGTTSPGTNFVLADGTFFQDRVYGLDTTTYHLYLQTNSAVPPEIRQPVGKVGPVIDILDQSSTGQLVQSLLLPLQLQQFPIYQITTNVHTDPLGTVMQNRFRDTTSTPAYNRNAAADTYTTTSVPTGPISTTTYALEFA